MATDNRKEYLNGLRDGIPIGLGYLAVSFSLGIFARSMGISSLQGFLASFFTIASAGEYAAFGLVGAGAAYWEMAVVILVTNSRYLLMSCATSQRLDPNTSFLHRVGIGALITDEIFGLNVNQNGYFKPFYTYGLGSASVLPWAVGTALGILAGNLLPEVIVSALSVAMYGMFLAVIIPPTRKNPIVAGIIIVCFLVSYFSRYDSILNSMSDGLRICILTVFLSILAALLFPVKEDDNA